MNNGRETDQSVWEVTAPPRSNSAALTDDLVCDVVIVGAGFTGLGTALALGEENVKVAVVESGGVGWGASGRSGGQVNPMLPVTKPHDLMKAVGPRYFERLAEISLNSADQLFALVKKHNISCDARQNGWLRVDHSASARTKAREAASAWNKFGAGFEFLDGDDVKQLSGSSAYSSAVLSPKGGAVQPLSLTRGLAQAAEAVGVNIFENTKVTAVNREGGKWVVSANGARIQTDWIVLATNGYTDDLLPGLKRTVLPLVPIQIATDPLSDEQIGAVLPHGHTISDTRRVIMYARREPDNRIVFGGIGRQNFSGDIGGFRWLVKDARRVFPVLHDVEWNYRWGGQIAFTADHVPHFHEPAEGIISGLGYNGRGVAMSLVMGRVLADRVLGAAPETLPFPVSKIKSIPFRDIQLFGSPIAISCMRFLDTMEMR